MKLGGDEETNHFRARGRASPVMIADSLQIDHKSPDHIGSDEQLLKQSEQPARAYQRDLHVVDSWICQGERFFKSPHPSRQDLHPFPLSWCSLEGSLFLLGMRLRRKSDLQMTNQLCALVQSLLEASGDSG